MILTYRVNQNKSQSNQPGGIDEEADYRWREKNPGTVTGDLAVSVGDLSKNCLRSIQRNLPRVTDRRARVLWGARHNAFG